MAPANAEAITTELTTQNTPPRGAMLEAADPAPPVEDGFGELLALSRADLQSLLETAVCVVALPLKSHACAILFWEA